MDPISATISCIEAALALTNLISRFGTAIQDFLEACEAVERLSGQLRSLELFLRDPEKNHNFQGPDSDANKMREQISWAISDCRSTIAKLQSEMEDLFKSASNQLLLKCRLVSGKQARINSLAAKLRQNREELSFVLQVFNTVRSPTSQRFKDIPATSSQTSSNSSDLPQYDDAPSRRGHSPPCSDRGLTPDPDYALFVSNPSSPAPSSSSTEPMMEFAFDEELESTPVYRRGQQGGNVKRKRHAEVINSSVSEEGGNTDNTRRRWVLGELDQACPHSITASSSKRTKTTPAADGEMMSDSSMPLDTYISVDIFNK
ncbi:hypothetical protein B0H63DRAFT_558336 [Podospora didyma]|uniref:Fungal N-terminal domain-containing protein n=1 Tax=Podospora didyma TaxID=330526 RepID=A0AAE0U133_9PEZI|nr:hypothetical protein B0H63DRAFT_558336 [Podospora didyma]